jgi:hypothetical protein
MKPITRVILLLLSFIALLNLETALWAQPNWWPPARMQVSQLTAMNDVLTQVNLLQNTTRTASNFPNAGFDNVYHQFQILRSSYSTFTRTLTTSQTSNRANELAELAAGLDIIAEAFTNYQDDVANGRPPDIALNDMCQVLNEAAGVWLQEFNRVSSQLNVR